MTAEREEAVSEAVGPVKEIPVVSLREEEGKQSVAGVRGVPGDGACPLQKPLCWTASTTGSGVTVMCWADVIPNCDAVGEDISVIYICSDLSSLSLGK